MLLIANKDGAPKNVQTSNVNEIPVPERKRILTRFLKLTLNSPILLLISIFELFECSLIYLIIILFFLFLFVCFIFLYFSFIILYSQVVRSLRQLRNLIGLGPVVLLQSQQKVITAKSDIFIGWIRLPRRAVICRKDQGVHCIVLFTYK